MSDAGEAPRSRFRFGLRYRLIKEENHHMAKKTKKDEQLYAVIGLGRFGFGDSGRRFFGDWWFFGSDGGGSDD